MMVEGEHIALRCVFSSLRSGSPFASPFFFFSFLFEWCCGFKVVHVFLLRWMYTYNHGGPFSSSFFFFALLLLLNFFLLSCLGSLFTSDFGADRSTFHGQVFCLSSFSVFRLGN